MKHSTKFARLSLKRRAHCNYTVRTVKLATKSPIQLLPTQPHVGPASLLHYLGVVNYATNERVLGDIKRLMSQVADITLMVTSAGGPSGTAMSFYDTVRSVLRVPLTTIGSGDVDSSGMIIFCSGTRRWVTPHTTALLHPAGRHFSDTARYTAVELRAMVDEDEQKDALYARILAANSQGRLGEADVRALMRSHTVLHTEDLVRLGFAEMII